MANIKTTDDRIIRYYDREKSKKTWGRMKPIWFALAREKSSKIQIESKIDHGDPLRRYCNTLVFLCIKDVFASFTHSIYFPLSNFPSKETCWGKNHGTIILSSREMFFFLPSIRKWIWLLIMQKKTISTSKNQRMYLILNLNLLIINKVFINSMKTFSICLLLMVPYLWYLMLSFSKTDCF